MARGLCYPTGRETPMEMQTFVAEARGREMELLLKRAYEKVKEIFPEADDGMRYVYTDQIALPDAVIIAEFAGSAVVVVDRTGQKWRMGERWND